jgi:hypothetical protein
MVPVPPFKFNFFFGFATPPFVVAFLVVAERRPFAFWKRRRKQNRASRTVQESTQTTATMKASIQRVWAVEEAKFSTESWQQINRISKDKRRGEKIILFISLAQP